MTKNEALAKMAETIIGAYNGSYKPHIINVHVPMWVIYSSEGYSLVSSDRGERIEFTDSKLSDFVVHVFTYFGSKNTTWENIRNSDAVLRTLQEKYGSNKRFIKLIISNLPNLGDCLLCTEKFKNDIWLDSYYCFDEEGVLRPVAAAR